MTERSNGPEKQAHFSYDADGHLTAVTGESSYFHSLPQCTYEGGLLAACKLKYLTATFDHDPGGRLVTIHEGKSMSTFDWGPDGVVTVRRMRANAPVAAVLPPTAPGGVIWTFTYERHRLASENVSIYGPATLFAYDGDGRWTGTSMPDGSAAAGVSQTSEQLFYDREGRVVRTNIGYGDTEYTYDTRGRLVHEQHGQQSRTWDYDCTP